MALKVVNTESLDAVANAINAKAGTSGAIQFPDGFVEAIEAIQAGGGEDLSAALTEQEALVAELKSVIATKAKLGDAKLPSLIDGTVTELTAEDLAGATNVARYAFYYCNIKKVVIPDSVKSIGNNAFCNSTLESLTICNGVPIIDTYAFYQCHNLTSVTIGNGVTSIGSSAFNSCTKLASIVIPDNVTTLGSSAFNNCTKLASVTIGNSVTKLDGAVFYGCAKLPSIVIPDSVTSIGYNAFYNCQALEYVDMTAYGADGAFPTLLNTNAFSNCGTSTASGTFQIRVPSGRKAELAAMTNWSTYADNIVEV